MSPAGGQSVLDEILAGVRDDVAARQRQVSMDEIRDLAAAAPPPLDAYTLLRKPGVGVIAEVKRSSPTQGTLADIPDPAELAGEYAAGGARCISVLTESRWFGGSLADFEPVVYDSKTPNAMDAAIARSMTNESCATPGGFYGFPAAIGPVRYESLPPHIHIRIDVPGYKQLLTRYVVAPGERRGRVRLVLEPDQL